MSMGTNCAPILANLFLYSYKANFIQEHLNKTNEKKQARLNCKFKCSNIPTAPSY